MSNLISPTATAFSLYKSCLRQIRLLPSEYLRQFFRVRVKDDVCTVLERSRRPRLQKKRIKLLEWTARKLHAANKGDYKAFDHILDNAYGRRGKLRKELTEPLLSDPAAPPPKLIIPGVEKSRPPVYSREMAALLAVPVTRSSGGRVLSTRIDWPPKLPERANPESEDAKFWGPFSKRREVNARWEFFQSEVKKLFPPLQVLVEEQLLSGPKISAEPKKDLASLKHYDVRPLPLQDRGVFEEAEALAGPPSRIRSLTRKEKKALAGGQQMVHASQLPTPASPILHSRFVRRRYKTLLSRIPILTHTFIKDKNGGQRGEKYSVSFAPAAMANHTRSATFRSPKADPSDLEWLAHVEAQRKNPIERAAR